ncbi:MAG: hypothetical protein HYV27_18110 [Candidatus Hydrogenedentes bacterium]|nr:hypothetical protein [Candidatus Hydrogenedentota bacterium]
MEFITCPHCHAKRLVGTKIPKDVVAVLPCPACQELSVMFRGKTIAINRKLLEEGDFEMKKNHLAEIVGEFLEAGVFPFRRVSDDALDFESEEDAAETGADDDAKSLISDQEAERFVQVDLQCLDDPSYFKKHFG